MQMQRKRLESQLAYLPKGESRLPLLKSSIPILTLPSTMDVPGQTALTRIGARSTARPLVRLSVAPPMADATDQPL
jgi:hypothetical protein